MTNTEKYKSAKEREEAFSKFCGINSCTKCPLNNRKEDGCCFLWLELEAEEEEMTATEVADILTEHNKWRRGEGEYAEAGAKCNISQKELGIAIDRAIEILRSIKE